VRVPVSTGARRTRSGRAQPDRTCPEFRYGRRRGVADTAAGRAHQLGEILPGTGADGARVLWVDGVVRLPAVLTVSDP
jgi:hypothetical protein